MKKAIFFAIAFFSSIQAQNESAIGVIEQTLLAMQKDLEQLKKTDVATVEEVDALSTKISTLTADMNRMKAESAKAAPKEQPKPTQKYQHCICTHKETGGTLSMHSYGKQCYAGKSYMTRDSCAARSTTSSPDLQLVCSLVTTDSPLPEVEGCTFFTT